MNSASSETSRSPPSASAAWGCPSSTAHRRGPVHRHDPARARPRGHVPRHLRHVRERATTSSWWAAPSPAAATRCSWPRSSPSAGTTAATARSTTAPSGSARPATRRCAASAWTTSTSTTCTAATRDVPIEESVGAMGELVEAGQGAPPRPLRGEPGHAARRARDASDRRAPERVVAVHARIEEEIMPDGPRAGRGHRALQPARPRRAVRHARDRRPRATSAPTCRASRRATASTTSSCRRGSASSPRRSAARPVQLALAWLLHQGEDVVPIPGHEARASTWRRTRPPRTWSSRRSSSRRSTERCPPGAVAGDRYPAEGMATVER